MHSLLPDVLAWAPPAGVLFNFCTYIIIFLMILQ